VTNERNKFASAFKRYRDLGGHLVVDGKAPGDAANAGTAVSCLDSDQIAILIDDMGTLSMMMETLPNPNSYKPDEIPSRKSKPTIRIDCASGDKDITWSG
jgi:hypothetical protein